MASMSLMEVKPSIMPVWCSWTWSTPDIPYRYLDLGLLRSMHVNGITPIIFWQPTGEASVHKNILSGNFDSYIDAFAMAVKGLSFKIIIRFAHEFNGNWFPWSVNRNGNTKKSYREMWRYVVDRFRRITDNVEWFWCPNMTPISLIDNSYPGDNYVDYVGFDGYAWNTDKPVSAATLFRRTVSELKRFGKPIIVGEFGVAHNSNQTTRLKWLIGAVNWFKSVGVYAAIYFDIDMSGAGHRNWRLTGITDAYWNRKTKRMKELNRG